MTVSQPWLRNNYFGFGSADAYARAIQEKIGPNRDWSRLTNPAEGRLFMEQYQPAGGGGQGGGGGRTDTATNAQFPYQSFLESLMSRIPQWNQSPTQMQENARLWANLQIDPQISQLTRTLEQAMTNAQSQKQAIRAAFEGVPEQLERTEQRQAQADLESAIARGAGRSGVVDWQTRNRQEHFNQLLSQNAAQQAAQLAAVANQLGLTQQQTLDAMNQLEAQRGQLTQSFLSQLEDRGFTRGMQGTQAQMDLANLMANLAQNWNNAQWAQGRDIMDRTMLTPAERHQLNIQYGELIGQIPDYMLDAFGNLIRREQPGKDAGGGTATATRVGARGGTYIIQRGDTLGALARRWGTTVSAIMRANPQIKDPNRISAGAKLTRP